MSKQDTSHYLCFSNIQKSYDQKTLVVKDFSLNVAKGEFLTLLGPSGSGKTTVLMMVAGFESVTSGDILLDGVPITRTAPYKRNIGMVFQNYALFPHMSIAENLAYPLKVRKMPKAQIDAKVKEYLELIELGDMGGRKPAQLSGGQRQRVAVARALIFDPSLVLMDEPLGALDKKLREQMQLEIMRLHKKIGFTVIYVTHDQTEALTMSDRIAVFNDGIVQQCAAPDILYEHPENSFVADFIGDNNFVPGTVIGKDGDTVKVQIPGGGEINTKIGDCGDVGTACRVSIRPEKLFIMQDDTTKDNRLDVKYSMRLYVGDFIQYFFKLDDGTDIVVKILNDHEAPKFKESESVSLTSLKENCTSYAAI
uniref:Spermidine/putrescine import ATP-binding protein PotA n=1 Tax=OCS116 cluster bacterium TaxID=2030921 RepID=A0A2A4Z5Q1_9PROT